MSEPDAPVVAEEEQIIDPNAPWSPDEGKPDEGMDEEELEILRANLPVVQEILEWFDEQIKGYLNPNVIKDVSIKDDPKKVLEAVLFAQQLSRDYHKKRKQFAKRFEQYLKPPEPTE